MPFMSYQTSREDALRNAGRLLKEGGAQSVKLEGGVHVAETVRFIVNAGIPVMGHIGLTPQSINQLGGYKVQGKTPAAAARLINDAEALEQAGAYAIVLECVPAQLAATITERLTIPTIGIGAGPDCDGQVQVYHVLLGLFEDFVPRHAKRYAALGPQITEAVRDYANEVRERRFPTEKESFLVGTPYFQRQQRYPRGEPPFLPQGPEGAPRLRGCRPSFACRPPLHRSEPLGAVSFPRGTLNHVILSDDHA